MQPQLAVVRDAPRTGRIGRNPSHGFNLKYRPFQIQPIMIAPVLPGETLKNLLMQARVVTDPIKNPLIGWWTEYYFFYVKLRDLADRDLLTDMIVTNASTSSLASAAHFQTYHNGQGINFTEKCLHAVTSEYFRDEDQAVLDNAIDGLPVANVNHPGWTDSIRYHDETIANDDEFPGENPALPSNMALFADHFAQWEAMRDMQLTAATFEDWLRTFGVSVPKAEAEELHRPELVRYVRNWSYPSNTVDPSNGQPSSAVSWSVAERADKDRFLKEPGFIFGVTVTRPKVYFTGQVGAVAHFMNDAFSWLPAVLQSEPYTSLKKFAASNGPLGQSGYPTKDYWIDLRDLFVHGDQFVNYKISGVVGGANANEVHLPSADELDHRLPDVGVVDRLFADVAKNKITVDGRVDLRFLTRIEDTSL